MNDSIQKLLESYPASKKLLDSISLLLKVTRSFEFPVFFEPIGVIEQTCDPIRIRNLNADMLASWITHISHASRVRMESLEESVLAALALGKFLSAAILTRAHMESAASVTYANELLLKCSDQNNWEKLERLIPKMLFSSAVMHEKKNLPADTDLNGVFATPTSIMNAIDAMDNFLSSISDNKTNESRILYAILCDYAHPTMGGVKHFVSIKGEDSSGWRQQYQRKENINGDEIKFILRTLLRNMRVGYANATLIYTGEIAETEHGFHYNKPSSSVGAAIWKHILCGEQVG